MNNFTIEDYKKAVKAKYDKEKDSDSLSSPSQANLRDLCWEIFEESKNEDDLIVFCSFFGFAFDVTKKNQFKEYTDKFKPIGTFFKGKTDLTSRSAVNLAAILVDYECRPFKKFKEKGLIIGEEEIMKIPESFVSVNREEISNNNIEEEKIKLVESENFSKQSKPKSVFENVKRNSLNLVRRRFKEITVAFVVLFCVGFALLDKAFTKKKCMQWSGDHYEIVKCDLKREKDSTLGNIELLDESVVHLRKITVSDTTNCFDKNGLAIVWYAKNGTGIDFFNAHGRHPENNSSLKPVTNYILDKYVKKQSRFNARI